MFRKMTNQYNQYEFVCDTADDIENLPTLENKVDGYASPAPGSTAFVIDGSLCYMYGNDDQWHEI